MGEARTATWDSWERHLGTVDTGFGGDGDFMSINMWVNNRGLLATTNKPYSAQPHHVNGSGLSFGNYAQVVGLAGGFGALGALAYRLVETKYITSAWDGEGNPGAAALSENGWGGMWCRFGPGETGVVTGRAAYIYGGYGNDQTLISGSLPAAKTMSVARNRERLYISQDTDRVYYGGLGGYGPLNGTAYFDVGDGDQIHSLVTSPAGLLIFADNAIYILRGDPQGGDLRMLTNIGTMPYATAVGDETFAMSTEGDPIVITGQGSVSRPAPQFKWRHFRRELIDLPDVHVITKSRWQIGGSSNGANVFMICCNGSKPAPNDFPGSDPNNPQNQSLAVIRKNGVWVPFVFDRIANGVAWGENMSKLGAYDYGRNKFEFFHTDDYPDDVTGPPLAATLFLPYVRHQGMRLVPRQVRAYVWHFPGMGDASLRGACVADYRNTSNDPNLAAGQGAVGDPVTTPLQQRFGPSAIDIATPQRRCYTWNIGGVGWGRALRVQFASIINCAFERVDLDYEVLPNLPS